MFLNKDTLSPPLLRLLGGSPEPRPPLLEHVPGSPPPGKFKSKITEDGGRSELGHGAPELLRPAVPFRAAGVRRAGPR